MVWLRVAQQGALVFLSEGFKHENGIDITYKYILISNYTKFQNYGILIVAVQTVITQVLERN